MFPSDGSSRLAGLASEEGVGHELVAANDAAVVGMSCPKLVKIIGRTKRMISLAVVVVPSVPYRLCQGFGQN